jgi:predicted nucleotidyltransferase
MRVGRSKTLDYPNEVTEILEQLLQGVQQELPNNVVGLYLRGSLAYGDFNADTSDLDILVVTERAINNAEFGRLFAFHQRLANLPNPYAKRIEIAYLDKAAVREFQPRQRYPTLEQGAGESLKWAEHGRNWVLERWTVREYGRALSGPNPRTFIKPISPDEIRQAVCVRLKDWVAWAQDENDPDWQLPKSHKAYVIETMCRALYTLENGELASKPHAVLWALQNLSRPWRELVEQSQKWRTDNEVNLSVNPDVRRFVLWVASSNKC